MFYQDHSSAMLSNKGPNNKLNNSKILLKISMKIKSTQKMFMWFMVHKLFLNISNQDSISAVFLKLQISDKEPSNFN